MAELAHLVEFVSIDILLVGLVFSFFLVSSVVVWHWRRDSVRHSLLKIVEDVRGCLTRGYSWVALAVLLVLVSQLGTVLVRFSDEILDSQKAVTTLPFFYVPALNDFFECRSSWGGWKEEDLLKLDVLQDAFVRADFIPKIKELLARHLPPEDGGYCSSVL